MAMVKTWVLLLVFAFSSGAAAKTATLEQQQKELVAMLQQIITQHLGLDGCELAEVDSASSLVVQIYCPGKHTETLLGQSGMLLRSLKILFNDLYLGMQQREVEQSGRTFAWKDAKKMHLRFLERE